MKEICHCFSASTFQQLLQLPTQKKPYIHRLNCITFMKILHRPIVEILLSRYWILILFFLSTWDIASAQNNALHFDGQNDHVRINTSLGNFGTGSMTITAWIKTSANTPQSIVTKRQTPSHGNFFRFFLSGAGILQAEFDENINGNPYQGLVGSTPVNDGTWHHIAIVRDGLRISFYVDGNLDAIQTYGVAANIINNYPFIIGRWNINGTTPHQHFAGEMDELTVWNIPRSQSQLQSSLCSPLTGNEAGLQAYWNFNQGTAGANNAGQTALPDQSSNSNTGTLTAFSLNGTTSNWVQSQFSQASPCAPSSNVPTLSQWGLIVLMLLIANIGALALKQAKPATPPASGSH